MPQDQREPRYAPGCSEDYLNNNSFSSTKQRRRRSFRLSDLLILLLLIVLAALYFKNKVLPSNSVLGADIDIEITSVDYADSGTVYVSILVTNPNIFDIYDIDLTATLFDTNDTVLDERTDQPFGRIKPGETQKYTFVFDRKDYTGFSYVNIDTEYRTMD